MSTCTPDHRSQAEKSRSSPGNGPKSAGAASSTACAPAGRCGPTLAGRRALRGGALVRLRPRDQRAARRRRVDRPPEPGPVRQPRRHPAHPGAAAEIRDPGELLRAGRLGPAPSRRAAPRGRRGPRDRHPRLDPRAQLDPARGVGARPADALGRHAGEDHRRAPGRHPHAVVGLHAAHARHHARHGPALRLLADGRRRLLRAAARRRSRPAWSSCRSSGSATTRSTST